MAAVKHRLIKDFFNVHELMLLQKYCYNKLDADTDYNVVVYLIKNAGAGGSYLKIGSEAAVDTGFNEDNSAKDGVGDIQIGAIDHYWGDGANDTTMTIDNWEIYLCDAR